MEHPNADDLNRALSQLGADLRRSAGTTSEPGPARWIALGAAALFALFVAATPPGHALAENIGEAVGIGGKPTLDPTTATPPPQGQAVVLDSGSVPGSDIPYEISGYASSRDGGYATCLNIDFPSVDKDASPGVTCVNAGNVPADGVRVTAFGFPGGPGDPQSLLGEGGAYLIAGVADPDVDRVTVSFDDPVSGERRTVDAAVGEVSGDVADQIGTEVEVGEFLAFIPSDEPPPKPESFSVQTAQLDETALVTGYTEDGEVKGTEDFRDQLTLLQLNQDQQAGLSWLPVFSTLTVEDVDAAIAGEESGQISITASPQADIRALNEVREIIEAHGHPYADPKLLLIFFTLKNLKEEGKLVP